MKFNSKQIVKKYAKILAFLIIPTFLFLAVDTRGVGVRPACITSFTYNYISDGQDHNMFFDSTSTLIKIHFCKELVYHIEACNNQSASFLFELHDSKGNLIYTSSKEQSNNKWTIKFDDPMDCSLKLTKLSPENKAVAVNLLIGFKP